MTSAAVRWVLFAAALAVAPCAFAEAGAPAPHGNSAAADVLFERGQKAMQDGHLDRACSLFDASFKIEASVGAMLNLALCHEKRHMTATAFSEYKRAAKLAYELKDDRRAQIEDVAAKLEKQLSRLTIGVERPQPGLVIAVDGLPLPSESFGVALPYDPGERVVTARAPGLATWTETVTLKPNGDSELVAVPRLKPASHRKGQLIAGGVLGGVGLLGVIAGAAAGIQAIRLKSTVSGEVDGNKGCLPSAPSCPSDEQALTRTANLSTGLFIAGGVLAAAGVVVVITAPKADGHAPAERAALRVAPLAGPGAAGLALSGWF